MLINLALVCVMPLAMDPPSLGQWMANATIVPGLWGYDCIEPVTWTLQVELLFYMILLTWFSLGAFRRPLVLTWTMLAVIICVCLPMKYSWIASGSLAFATASALESVLILPTLPLFLIGLLLNERRCGRGSWLAIGSAIVGCGAVFHLVDQRGFNPAATALFTVLLGLSAYGRLPVLRFKPIVFVAGISYSLYLLHNNLGSTLIFHLDPLVGPWPALLLSTGLVVGIATLSTYWFERPLSAWLRKKWTRYRSGQIAAGGPPGSLAYPLSGSRRFALAPSEHLPALPARSSANEIGLL
jgi:peptidoglycan/LPS O-acetylase OafA/YrhL